MDDHGERCWRASWSFRDVCRSSNSGRQTPFSRRGFVGGAGTTTTGVVVATAEFAPAVAVPVCSSRRVKAPAKAHVEGGSKLGTAEGRALMLMRSSCCGGRVGRSGVSGGADAPLRAMEAASCPGPAQACSELLEGARAPWAARGAAAKTSRTIMHSAVFIIVPAVF